MKQATEKDTKTEPKQEVPAVTYYEGIGRRKVSTARVRLYVVTESKLHVRGADINRGDVVVNGKSAEQYFPGDVMKKIYMEPFRTTNTIGRFAVSITAHGGGLNGQLSASLLGISRALEQVDKEKFRPILKKRGFLMRDPRAKQRRKAGYAGKSRARKQSPKR